MRSRVTSWKQSRLSRTRLWKNECRDWKQTGVTGQLNGWGWGQRVVSSWWEGPRGCHQDDLFLAFSVTTLFIVPMLSFNFINLLTISIVYLLFPSKLTSSHPASSSFSQFFFFVRANLSYHAYTRVSFFFLNAILPV